MSPVRRKLVAMALFASLAGCSQSGEPANRAEPVVAAKAGRTFSVEGMSCEGCVSGVTKALEALPGVRSVDVSLEEKRATVDADAALVSDGDIEAAIAKAGYQGRPSGR